MSRTDHQQQAFINPEPYNGNVIHPHTKNELSSMAEAATNYNLPPIIKRHGVWAICSDGLHCLFTKYHVAKNRFDEDDWISHVTQKQWVDNIDFIAAFEEAKEMARSGKI